MFKLKEIEREKEDKNKKIIIGWAKKATRVNEGKFDNTILKVASSAIAAFYDTNEEIPSYYLSNLIKEVLIDYIHKKLQCSCFQELNQGIKDKFENLERKVVSYCYLTAISVPEDFPIELDKIDSVGGYKFRFIDLYPEKFERIQGIEGDSYTKVLICLDANSPDIAFHKAHQFLLAKIAMWSLLYTKYIFSFEDNKSLNPFTLGEVHTLHIESNGEKVRTYIEPNYICKPKWSIQFEGCADRILSESSAVEEKLHKLTYSKKIINAMCNYTIIASEFNNMNLLNELWTVIEVLNKKEQPEEVPRDIVGKKGLKESNTANSAILRCCESIGRDEKLLLHSARIIRNISTHDTYRNDYAKYICQELCKVLLDVLIYHSGISSEASFDRALPKVTQEYCNKIKVSL